jgi:hypothetical protein
MQGAAGSRAIRTRIETANLKDWRASQAKMPP